MSLPHHNVGTCTCTDGEHRLECQDGASQLQTAIRRVVLSIRNNYIFITTSQYLWKFHSFHCLVTKPGSQSPPPLFSKPVAPPPLLLPRHGGNVLSFRNILKTLNTLINMKEVTNSVEWGVTQGVIAMHGRWDRVVL